MSHSSINTNYQTENQTILFTFIEPISTSRKHWMIHQLDQVPV